MAQAVAFQAALTRLGFGQPAIAALDVNGLTGVRDLINLTDKDVEQLLKIVRTGPPPVVVPFLAQKRLNIFCYWATKRHRLNEPIDAGLFNQAAIEAYGSMMTLEEKDEEVVVKAPGEYKKDTKWKSFKEGAIAYFNGIKGNHNIPLAYVIRDQEVPQVNQAYQSEHHRIVAITPLAGAAYEDDNGKVFDLLKSWTINGPAWTWMRAHNSTRNGRLAWLSLVNHFEGDAQRDRVKDAAYASIAAARYYGDKKKFTFETYVSIHQEAYADLEQYGEIISEEKRVRDLLSNIKDNSPVANAAKGTILATPTLRTNFSNAVAHLATTLQLGQSQETRNISSTQSSYRGGSRGGRGGRGRGRGRGGRGRGRNIYLGSYSPEAWQKLSSEDKKRVIEGREKSAQQQTQSKQGGRGGGGTSRQIAMLATSAEADPLATDTTTINTNMDHAVLQGALQGSAAVSEKRANTEAAGSQMSRRRINKVVSSVRLQHRNISKMTYRQVHSHDDVRTGSCELDSHADTCVAGSNCVILEVTNQTVNVSAFTEAHGVMQDIPIVTAATAFDDEKTGVTYILILGQCIYMGEHMNNSLLCPNQLRAHGIVVDDCPRHLAPADKPSIHSIYAPDEEFTIPLALNGVTSYFTSRTPTVHELETCKWIILTNEHEWDPHSDYFQSQEQNFQDLEDLPRQHRERSIYKTTTTINRPSYDTDFEQISSALDDRYFIAATTTTSRLASTNADDLAKKWCIGIETAKKTLRCTTQKGIRNTMYPIERRFRTRQAQLRYNQLSGRHGRFYTDTFFSSVPSLNGSKMAQLYINDLSFTKTYPMKLKSEVADTLSKFIHEVGIPHAIHSDDAPELMQGKFKQLCKEYQIQTSYTEPYSPWQNRAEGGIREIKRLIHRKMTTKGVPQRLWDFCMKWTCEVKNKSASNIYALEYRTPYEATLGNTPDISSLIPFDFYDIIWYHEEISSFPEPKLRIGRWLGEAADFGQSMCYWILSDKAVPIVRSTVQVIPPDKLQTEVVKAQVASLDVIIEEKWGKPSDKDSLHKYDLDSDTDPDVEDYVTPEYVPIDHELQMPEADEWDPEAFDKYIAAEVRLPKNGEEILGKVIARKRDHDGNPIGKAHNNPILDTRLYQVIFPDGETAEYSANVIAESLYSQIDNEGNQFLLLDELIDWKRTSESIPDEDILQISHNGNIHKRRTTKGWKICVKWKDGSTSWEPLKDLKEAYPLQVAEFAVRHELQDLPAFRWWVKDTLKRRDRIIKAVKSRYIKRTHKYGIPLPKTVQEAYDLDRESGTDYWHKAIIKEMTNNAIAFKFLDDGECVPPGSQWIPFHMIFDVKCDFTRKARFVAGGHRTDAPSQLTYSSVVTRDSVRIAFLIAALNDLEILAADIGNAYLQAPAREKVHTTAGPEFGPNNVGKTVIIVRAMYGLKSSGAAWHAKFSETLRSMNFQPSLADPDVWFRPATKDSGFEYYEYILVYVDDVLVVSASPTPIMKTIQIAYRLKDPPAPPSTYLGATIKPWSIPSEIKPVWSMNCVQYVKEAIKNVELELNKSNYCLRGKPTTPMQVGYRPELDVSPVLGPEQANYYQSLIGILRWAVELGRIDIYIDVAMLSSHLAEPRVGHLEQVFHIFSYLKHHINSHLVFDPQYVAWENAEFKEHDWQEFYRDAQEAIPTNAPEPRGHAVQMNAFVDANHAGNKITRRSHTGILIYLNCAPIIWYSKAQNTVESSTFGSEFIAMRILVELLESLRYKLRMMGIPIDGPVNTFCDNKSVVTNATTPTSTLKKKHNSIAYHRVREAVAAKILQITKVHTSENLADLLTKPLAGPQLKQLIQKILW